MIQLNDIIQKILIYYIEADIKLIEKAYNFAAKLYEGKVTDYNTPYLSHNLEVAMILSDMKLDPTSIASGILHDILENSNTTEQELFEIFGDSVGKIVVCFTKISQLNFQNTPDSQAESIKRMIFAIANDIRVILIILADQLHSMRILHYNNNSDERKKIANQTLDIYAPISARLGIYWIKQELEDLSFMHARPSEYKQIEALIDKDKVERDKYVQLVMGILKKKMDEVGIVCKVSGRYKQYYSIYNKMKKQALKFEEVFDIIAFRIIVDNVQQCYEVLGHLHSIWKYIPKKLKDYISFPKSNMYQSIHTTVIGPLGQRVEIQIRTSDMDRIAESGIAAHWSYKEGKLADEKMNRILEWINNLVENNEGIKDSTEFLENVRINLYPDEVYVFTPKGEIKSLPIGATPIDFAYMVHSEVGDQCIGAKVNGKMVPLKYMLKVGDSIEIITSKKHHPSKDWLKFVRTTKAKTKIRQWIKNKEKERSLILGKEMCEKIFHKHNLNYPEFIKSDKLNDVLSAFTLKTIDDLLENVGYGKITPLQIIQKINPKADKSELSIFDRVIRKVLPKKKSSGIFVLGSDDLLVRFGKCCRPVPGDPIIGYITVGYGITVHHSHCKNALTMNPDRQIEVKWAPESKETYPAKILVKAHDRFGLLSEIATSITKNNANITKAQTNTDINKIVTCVFNLEVKDTDHLLSIISNIKKIKLVQEAKRIEN
ncbi:MAG: bifunctional (p)ppGpp synthetase/guanosine-3',5'-bis(diphosphate) 3'-pyrophosphohydrolase [Desulfobacterales bacterium]|nr:bifunctional (p)ppGpp synthetase/guanosine-3',5'-bis(diphosphate) 3'-pyrophosphohydrolase [Desulfobacterales bacterium]